MRTFFNFLYEVCDEIEQLRNLDISQFDMNAEEAERDIFKDLYESRYDEDN